LAYFVDFNSAGAAEGRGSGRRPETLVVMAGAVEGALDAGFVAALSGEGVGAPAEDVGQLLGLVEAIVPLLEVILVVEDTGFDNAGFVFRRSEYENSRDVFDRMISSIRF
jgi:hypothetical protein